MVFLFQQYYKNNNNFITKKYNDYCECVDVGYDTSIKLMIALGGYMVYSFVKTNTFTQTLTLVTYKAVYVYTKINNNYNKLKSFFSNKFSKSKNEEIANHDDDDNDNDSYTNYEIRVIKNGMKCEQFETMKDFKESNYLGNPNDYCDFQDDESQNSHSFDGCDNCDSPDDESHQQEKTKVEEEQLLIMKQNKENNTVQFVPYDFIMQTLFFDKVNNQKNNCTSKQSGGSKQNKNYTKLHRKFIENNYLISPNDLVISKAGMIVCSLEYQGKTYDIDITFPYNFNVVGNIILDHTFLTWYMLKEYEVTSFADHDCEYTVTCITNKITMHKFGKSSMLLVKVDDYEIRSF